jgi:hypothetical protein
VGAAEFIATVYLLFYYAALLKIASITILPTCMLHFLRCKEGMAIGMEESKAAAVDWKGQPVATPIYSMHHANLNPPLDEMNSDLRDGDKVDDPLLANSLTQSLPPKAVSTLYSFECLLHCIY